MHDAISASRCLARLVQLTDWSLLALLWPAALRLARLVANFRSGTPSPQAMATFEEELNRLLCEMGRRIVEWGLNGLEPKSRAEMPALLFRQMDAYRPKRLSPMRNLNCLFGPIRVSRWLYESLDDLGLPSLFPLEQALGIVAGVAVAVHSLKPALHHFGRFVKNRAWMKSSASRKMSGRGGSAPSG